VEAAGSVEEFQVEGSCYLAVYFACRGGHDCMKR